MASTPEQQLRMYGDPDWEEQCQIMFAERPFGGMKIFAMGILSDAQEILAATARKEPREYIAGDLETARQYMNKAKYVMSNMLVTAPSDEERTAVRELLHHHDPQGYIARHLNWLLDPRR